MKRRLLDVQSAPRPPPAIWAAVFPGAWANSEHTLCSACVGKHLGSPIWQAVFGKPIEGEPGSELYLPFGEGSKVP